MAETLRLVIRGPALSGWEHEIKRALLSIDGVEGVTASYKAHLVGITFDPVRVSADDLTARLEALGYSVSRFE